jgi:hypothetical protein
LGGCACLAHIAPASATQRSVAALGSGTTTERSAEKLWVIVAVLQPFGAPNELELPSRKFEVGVIAPLGSASSFQISVLPTPETGWMPSPAGPNQTWLSASSTLICVLSFETEKLLALMNRPVPALLAWTLIHQSPAAGA